MLGVLGLGYAVSAFPLERYYFQPVTLTFLGVIVLALVSVPAGAYLHSRHDLNMGRRVLWGSTGVLACCTFLSFVSIGLLLLPAVIFAIVAVIASRS